METTISYTEPPIPHRVVTRGRTQIVFVGLFLSCLLQRHHEIQILVKVLLQQLRLPSNRIVEDVLQKPVPLSPVNFRQFILHDLLFFLRHIKWSRFLFPMLDLYLLEQCHIVLRVAL